MEFFRILSVTLYLFNLLQFILVISPGADHIADRKKKTSLGFFFLDSLGTDQHGRFVSVISNTSVSVVAFPSRGCF